jgi:hypothetical protein
MGIDVEQEKNKKRKFLGGNLIVLAQAGHKKMICLAVFFTQMRFLSLSLSLCLSLSIV